MSKPNIKIGTYTGTGAAKNIELGWLPDYVEIWNVTDGTNESVYFSGMADGSAESIITTAGPVLDTTNQVSPYAGDSTHAAGFTAGTDVSVNAKVYRYVAMRNV